MRKTALQVVTELARRDGRVVFVGSDLGVGTLSDFQKEMPDRFYMEGISEAAVIGMAAGLAMDGWVPYVNTIATFLTRRCYEQVVLDLSLHHLPVRLIGNGGGLVYAPLGPTHQATEDLAIMRAVPNMTVLAPADAEEMRRLMLETLPLTGPVYVRVAKGGDPIVTTPEQHQGLGKAVAAKEGKNVLLATTGICLGLAREAATKLEERGLSVCIRHFHTVKPFDTEGLLKAVDGKRAVVTVEEHSVIGGLGGAVAEALAEAGCCARLRRVGLPDVFADDYGSQKSLMAKFGMSAEGVVAAALDAHGS